MTSPIKSMFVRILICLEIALFFTSALANDYLEGTMPILKSSSRKFCGRSLTDSLALICNGEYENLMHSKRSDESMDEYAYNDQAFDDLPLQYQTYAYLSKLMPEVARSRVRREWIFRRGAYDECCRKPCSIEELRSYCKQKN